MTGFLNGAKNLELFTYNGSGKRRINIFRQDINTKWNEKKKIFF